MIELPPCWPCFVFWDRDSSMRQNRFQRWAVESGFKPGQHGELCETTKWARVMGRFCHRNHGYNYSCPSTWIGIDCLYIYTHTHIQNTSIVFELCQCREIDIDQIPMVSPSLVPQIHQIGPRDCRACSHFWPPGSLAPALCCHGNYVLLLCDGPWVVVEVTAPSS